MKKKIISIALIFTLILMSIPNVLAQNISKKWSAADNTYETITYNIGNVDYRMTVTTDKSENRIVSAVGSDGYTAMIMYDGVYIHDLITGEIELVENFGSNLLESERQEDQNRMPPVTKQHEVWGYKYMVWEYSTYINEYAFWTPDKFLMTTAVKNNVLDYACKSFVSSVDILRANYNSAILATIGFCSALGLMMISPPATPANLAGFIMLVLTLAGYSTATVSLLDTWITAENRAKICNQQYEVVRDLCGWQW